MRNHRWILLLIICLLALPAFAQKDADKELTFVYISHDINTPVQTLCSRLKDLYNDARNYPEDRAVVFYLANGDYPIICKMNIEGGNHNRFEDIISELQVKRSHDCNPVIDIRTINDLFDVTEIVLPDGSGAFRSITWQWYVNGSFWEMEYNKTIIGAVYTILGMDEMIRENYLSTYMFYSEDDDIPLDRQYPFGAMYSSISINDCPLLPY